MGIAKKICMRFCALIVVFLMIPAGISIASLEDISDINGHWAQNVMKQAYVDGLVLGEDGYLFPDESITTAQAITILCRVFAAETAADISDSPLSDKDWCYEYAAKAVYLGLISSSDIPKLNDFIPRQDAFTMLASAFQIIETDADISVLEQFSDSILVDAENRPALASLVSRGIIVGYDGKLGACEETSRAEFISVLYRIIGSILPAANVEEYTEAGVLLRGSAELTGAAFGGEVWFDCAAAEITLNDVAMSSAVIRSSFLESLKIGGATHIGRLTIAAQSGDITVSPDAGSSVDTIVIGPGNGVVTVNNIKNIEVSGNDRQVIINGNVNSILVSGKNNSVTVKAGARVSSVSLSANARGSLVVSDGYVYKLEASGIKGTINGSGYINYMKIRRGDTIINVDYGKIDEDIDRGLLDASVRIDAPAILPAGTILIAAASVDNAAAGTECELTWYLDGAQMITETVIIGETFPKFSHEFEFSPDMPGSADVGVGVRYVTALGEVQEISANSSIMLENYDKMYWIKLEAPNILDKVTTGYEGDFTLQWALDNDLGDFEKEAWVNVKGYKSSTEYLLWINIAFQRVNIFIRSDGFWELIRTCVVGTGAPGMGTPVGVWTTSYKQTDGWNTSSYSVRPVVRFRDGSGYAFHSRLYYPDSATLLDPGIGYPISHGCIRMYDDDIWFIHDNIPDGTTVVVY